MPEKKRTLNRFSLPVYLLLALGITWLGWIPGLTLGARLGYVMPTIDRYPQLFASGFADPRHTWLAIAFALGVYGPLVGGLVATWMDSGRAGLADLWRRITHWRVGGRWYLSALAITFLIAGIPVAIGGLSGGFTLSAVPLTYVLLAFLMQLLTSGLGEEPGWRGYLLPRLQDRFTGEKPIWILGLIWAIWHYPIVIIQTLTVMQNVTVPQMVITILMSLAGQTMGLIGLTYLYVWLYNRTGSVLLSIVFHALSNLFVFWLSSFLPAPQAISLFIGLMPWAVVVFLQKRLGKPNFPGQPGT